MEDSVPPSSPGTWKLLGCENGLRFFQEVPSPQKSSTSLRRPQLKVVKCTGVIEVSAEKACSLILDYGPLRQQWDSSVDCAQVLESRDGKTDVLQLTMRSPTPAWWSMQQHLVLLRWWTKHLDGSYAIFFRALHASKMKQGPCSLTPTSSWLDCGAYIIRPIADPSPAAGPLHPATTPPVPANTDNDPAISADLPSRCVVELVLESEEVQCGACSWMSCCSTPLGSLYPLPTNSAQGGSLLCACGGSCNSTSFRNAMLHSVAGLREFCSATNGATDLTTPWSPVSHRTDAFNSHITQMAQMRRGGPSPSLNPSDRLRQPLLLRKVDSETYEDSFEDCTMDSLSDVASETFESGVRGMGSPQHPHFPPLVRVISAQERAYPSHIDWDEFPGSVRRGHQGEDCRNSWMPPHGTAFMVRSKTFYGDAAKTEAAAPLCQLVAVDWFHSQERMPAMALRRESLVQRVREKYKEASPYFIVINLQIPAGGKGQYSLLFYFATSADAPCLQPGSLLHRFITADDDGDVYRKQRLTLIPAVPAGSWLVRSAVGSERFVMLADVLSTTYVRGEGVLEIDVNMGTSSVVSGIMGLVIPCMSILTVDMAFLVKAEEGEQLPEELFGAVRCCNLEQGSAVAPPL